MTKKLLIIVSVLIGIVIFLIFGLGRFFDNNQKFDKFFTVSRDSYKPYDCKFFYDELKRNTGGDFSEIKVSFENSSYGLFGTLKSSYVVVSPYFYPSATDINHLKNFASKGNHVFIASFSLSAEFIDSLYYTPSSHEMSVAFPPDLKESRWGINWKGAAGADTTYRLWGHKPTTAVMDSIFLLGNNAITAIDTLVTDDAGKIQMLEITCGQGRIFLCNNPILISNYFLLYKNNYSLFNKIADKINLAESNVIWDDYYHNVNANKSEIGKSKVLEVISKNPPLEWAFYTFIAAVLLFILIYYRRIQKPIPVYVMPKNNSETYINTVSGLYWQQQNHKSIADKVIAQFFEYLLHNYQIHLKDFQETELEKISLKTGRSKESVREIFEEINSVRSQEAISKQSLMHLYQKINSFYQD